MTAPTVAVEWLLARAAVRATGLLHVVSRRDSGALNPVCGANPIRSTTIETHTSLDDVALLCPGCGTMAASIGGTVHDGVALLLGLSDATTTTRLLDVPIAAITLRDGHARQEPGDLTDLTASVLERGVVAPVVVRRLGAGFEVIDGARRVAAAHVAGLTAVPAIVRDATDVDAVIDGLVANVHRADLNPIDLAHAYSRALVLLGCSKAELGRRLGISREQVSNTVRLLALPDEDQERIAAGQLTAEGGRALLRGSASPVPARLTDVSALLAELLAAKVAVTARGDRTRIVIDVADADRDRILLQLGVAA
jgi:ParB/RepB/Spo0J family partition protein